MKKKLKLCKHVPCNTLTHSTNEDLLNIKCKGVTKNFLTFEKIKTLIKSNNFIRYYTLISNIPTDIKSA